MINRIKPIVAEADQRYWRSRANRRVRKARLTRTLGRWTVTALALAVIGTAVFQAASTTVERFRQTPEFAVDRIEIEGVERAGTDSVGRRLDRFLGLNIVDLRLDEVASAAGEDPWVLRASAKRILPGIVRVTVTERRPTALAVIGTVPHVVDATGYVVGPSGPELPDDLPVLTGLDATNEEILAAKLRRGVTAVDRLDRVASEWLREVSELDLSRADRIVVRTIDPGPAILLDPERVERNLVRYLALRSTISRRVGRASYVDLRWRDRISVMPAADNS